MGLSVAGYGWESERWVEEYYPGDLPPEWRLDYYANEFFAVLIPQPQWLAAGETLFAQWCEDVHEEFRFYLELLPQANKAQGESLIDALRQRVTWLGGAFGGVQLQAEEELPGWIYPELTELGGKIPLCVDGGECAGVDSGRLINAVSVCCQQGGRIRCQGGRLRIVRIGTTEDERSLRQLIETLCTQGEDESVLVCSDMPTLARAKIIAELLGC